MAVAIVKAVTHYNDPDMLAEVSRGLGEAMRGQSVSPRCRSRELLAREETEGVALTAVQPRVGVLALQGDFREHIDAAARPRRRRVEVRTLARTAVRSTA